MPVVTLRAPLKDLAGGNSEVNVSGSTVGEVLRNLEHGWPRTRGWVLDEQGHIRRHVNVFLNAERVTEEAKVGPEDKMHVLPAITGG